MMTASLKLEFFLYRIQVTARYDLSLTCRNSLVNVCYSPTVAILSVFSIKMHLALYLIPLCSYISPFTPMRDRQFLRMHNIVWEQLEQSLGVNLNTDAVIQGKYTESLAQAFMVD